MKQIITHDLARFDRPYLLCKRGILLSAIYYASLSLMHYLQLWAFGVSVCRALHLFTCEHCCSESFNLLQVQCVYASLWLQSAFACLLDEAVHDYEYLTLYVCVRVCLGQFVRIDQSLSLWGSALVTDWQTLSVCVCVCVCVCVVLEQSEVD